MGWREDAEAARQMEITRGREVSARYQRVAQIERWSAEGRIMVQEYDGHGAGFHTMVIYFIADTHFNVEIEERYSESTLAKLALAVAALQPEVKHAIPSTERDHSYRNTNITPSMRERYGGEF